MGGTLGLTSFLLLALLILSLASPLHAQAPLRVSHGVVPETVTVGDTFRSFVRVVAPAGSRVTFPTLAVADTFQPVDSLRVLEGGEGEGVAAAYTLVAWVTGDGLSARIPVRVTGPGGEARTVRVSLPLPVVRSVLPAGVATAEPRGAKGIVSVPRPPIPWWAWVLFALGAAAAARVAWRVARRPSEEAGPPALGPRDRALQELDRLRAAERGDHRHLYDGASRVLRRYLAELSPAWGGELTTRELRVRLAGARVAPSDAGRLEDVLSRADRVKFARHDPTREEALRFLEDAREWVAGFSASAPAREEAA